MAQDSDVEKTEPASAQRMDKAREEGQVARSRELSTFCMLATGLAVLWLGGESVYDHLSGIMRRGLWFDPAVARDASFMFALAEISMRGAAASLFALFASLLASALIAPVSVGGILLSTKGLQPKFERINLVKGLGRTLSPQTLIELLKTLLKALLVGGVTVWALSAHMEQMIGLVYAPQKKALATGITLSLVCWSYLIASLLLIVLIDVPWQIFSHRKKLRMSRQDVKQENKENDGDPQLKGRIRQQQRALARRRMMADAQHADVIVTNPTHYAVALTYRESEAGAPRVVAKGVGLVAERLRVIGQTHRIPTLSAPPLARALYHHVELGQEIPAALYAAVAEVLAWAYQLRSVPDLPHTPQS